MGWTKLSILATYGEAETIDDLLDVAEDCTAHELKMYSAMASSIPMARWPCRTSTASSTPCLNRPCSPKALDWSSRMWGHPR